MTSSLALAKINRIYAEAEAMGVKLAKTAPINRAAVVRPLLLNHCLELRAIMAGGTTSAAGIPLVDILQNTQRLMRDFRKLREAERRKLN